MTVTEFLEARIADDEAAVERRGSHPHSMHGTDIVGTYNAGCPDCLGLRGKARVSAECMAKRAIISSYVNAVEWPQHKHCAQPVEYSCMASGLGDAIRLLAAVYADHPEYDKDWAL